MNLKILELASLEIEDGKEYYNLQKDGLGDDFKEDIKAAINNIISFPNLYPKLEYNLRRVLLHRFSYSIFYFIDNEADIIIVLSVAHQRRKPYYWISNRLKNHRA